MRETIASTWIYQLVIIFILMFVAFLILSLTYSKNYKTKNEIIDIIEKYEGVNQKSVQLINNYLSYTGYKVKHSCPTQPNDWLGATSLENISLTKAQVGEKYYYCLRRVINSNKMYYQVKTFFKFNLPIFGDIHTFTVDGTTNDIFRNSDLFTDILYNKE